MKKSIFRLLIILGALIFFTTGCGSVKPIYDKNGNPVYLDEADYDKIFSNTDNYNGKFVKLKGKIFTDPEKTDGMIGFQMYTDVKKFEKNVVVYSSNDVGVKTDDYVELTGYISGKMEGTNAFGGSVTAPRIIATELKKSDYKNVVMPTIKEITFSDKTINQFGCIITVEKIEFAADETRVYVKAENKSGNEFDIYTYSAKVLQGSKQYDQTGNYDANYPELQSDLQPGVVSEGVLVFSAMNQSAMKLIIGGSSGDWNIDINDYSFDLDIK